MFRQLLPLLLGAALMLQPLCASAQPIPAYKLQEDLALLKHSIARVHPDPSFSADLGQLDAAFKSLERKLNRPMTPDQAWRAFAALNPVFNDAHLYVAMNGHVEQAQAMLQAGGGLFPYEVQVDPAGDVRIKSETGGGPSRFASMRIETINGVPARKVAGELLALTMGDNPALRANLLSPRWWRYYLRAYGATSHYAFTIATPRGLQSVRVAAARRLPAPVTDDTAFERNYQFEMLDAKTGLLTVKSFLWPDKKLFYAFTEKVFGALRDAQATTLIIDVRDNGGGDDDMWKEGLLRYIADKPYRHASAYRKMIIAGRASGTEKVGDIVDGKLDTWHEPEPGNPLRFGGKTYVLVGRTTYSSAILFANTMQDFQFGTLVGEAGYARARQSGGIQSILLPHTGLSLVVPRFLLDRPSGLRNPALLQPDLILPDNPFKPRALVDALHARVAGAASR